MFLGNWPLIFIRTTGVYSNWQPKPIHGRMPKLHHLHHQCFSLKTRTKQDSTEQSYKKNIFKCFFLCHCEKKTFKMDSVREQASRTHRNGQQDPLKWLTPAENKALDGFSSVDWFIAMSHDRTSLLDQTGLLGYVTNGTLFSI